MGRGKMLWFEVAFIVLAGFLFMPTAAAAQSAIAGTVTDATGGVLPGVTVEARSPALIEQMRTGVTDSQGQYRIVDLRPGEYTVTFTLTGFSTIVREGIVLSADFTAPVSVQMRVGAIEETLTVTGASPVVDVQTTTRLQVITQELIQALPTGRSREAFLATVPAVRTSQFDVGGSTQMDNGTAGAYGGRGGDQNVTIDGMSVGSMIGDGSISIYIDNLPIQEYSVQTTGMGADVQTSGVQINMVPKMGGNRFTHEFISVFSHDSLKSNNISNELRARGVKPQKITQAYDVDGSGGGPIVPNRWWYFFSGRQWSFNTDVFNLYHTGAIQGKPKGTPVEDENLIRAAHGRMTFQLTTNNRLSVMNERSWKNRAYQSVELGTAYPEARTRQNSPNTQIAQARWTSTLTNKLLLEAGWSFNHFDQSNLWPEGLPVPTVANPFLTIRRVDLRGTADIVANLPYGAPQLMQSGPSLKHWYTSTLTYNTGTHSLKGGFQYQRGFTRTGNSVPPSPELGASMMQRYLSGVPNSVVLYNLPRSSRNDMVADLGLFVQDAWTFGRLTFNAGLRYDYFHGRVPAQFAGPGRWVPARSFPEVDNVPLWHDVTPRLGASYDVFGNGKTAIKGSVGTFLWKSYTGIASRYNLMLADSDTRDWNDLNRNDIAEPNELGPSTNLTFGLPQVQRRLDPNLERERTRLYNVSVDHELTPGLGVSFAFNRRNNYDIGFQDNLATTFDDYTLFTVPDPRGNGQTVSGYYLNRNKLGINNNIDTTSDSNRRYYNGFDFNVRGRLPNGAQFYGGTSTGHLIEMNCDVENPNNLRFCDESQYDIPWLTVIKLSGSYPIWRNVRVSAVFQHLPFDDLGTGETREAVPSRGLEITYPVTRTLVPALTTSSVSVRLNEPGTEYLPAANQLDLSLSSSFPMGRARVRPVFDVFNVLNSGPVLATTTVFGPSLGSPRRILFPRFVRFGARIEF